MLGKIQNLPLEEKGEKGGLTLFQEGREKKEGRGVPISAQRFYLFLKQRKQESSFCLV